LPEAVFGKAFSRAIVACFPESISTAAPPAAPAPGYLVAFELILFVVLQYAILRHNCLLSSVCCFCATNACHLFGIWTSHSI
jgi:hypothetical protein